MKEASREHKEGVIWATQQTIVCNIVNNVCQILIGGIDISFLPTYI